MIYPFIFESARQKSEHAMSERHVRKAAEGEIDPETDVEFKVDDVGLVAERSWVCDKQVSTKAIKLAIECALGTGPRTVTRMHSSSKSVARTESRQYNEPTPPPVSRLENGRTLRR